MDFTFLPTKADGGGGIFTHCSTFYLIINVLIMVNLEDLTVKNIMLSNNIHKPQNLEFPTKVEEGGGFFRSQLRLPCIVSVLLRINDLKILSPVKIFCCHPSIAAT